MSLLGTTKSLAPSGVDLIRHGVSTSTKSWLSRNLRVSSASLLLNIILLRTGLRLISMYLYFIRISSPPSVSSSIVNGGVIDALSTLSSDTLISISPVALFAFLLLRSATSPFTCTTNSLPSLRASSVSASLDSILNTSCVIPYLSLISTKVIPPRSLPFCTHPLSVTCCPMCEALSSPQLCDLYI